MPNSAPVCRRVGPTTAVLGANRLYRTTDGGAPLRAGHATSEASLRGSTWGSRTPRTASAIGYVGSSPTPGNERLYYSIDGGATYHLVSTG